MNSLENQYYFIKALIQLKQLTQPKFHNFAQIVVMKMILEISSVINVALKLKINNSLTEFFFPSFFNY